MSIIAGAQSQPWSGVLSSSRAADWKDYAGIPGYSSKGALPSDNWTQCGATIAPYGSSGSPSAATTITNALLHTAAGYSGCGANTYILLGAGDFYLSSAINAQGLQSNELRGSGPTRTRLHFSGATNCASGNGGGLICMDSSDTNYAKGPPTTVNVTSGYTQGSTSLTVSSSTNIVVGTMIVLDQCDTGFTGAPCTGTATDNGNFFSCQAAYNPSGPSGCSYNASVNLARPDRGQQEMHVVTACSPSCNNSSSTVLTLQEPIANPNWASRSTPQAWYIQPSKNIGVRDLLVDGSTIAYGNITSGIEFSNDNQYWVRNVAFESLANITLFAFQSMHADLSSNYIYNSGQSSTTTDNSGINFFGSYNLIANNICENCHLALIVDGPAVGNVIAYNLILNAFTGNATMFGSIWDGHSNGSDYNLYEGNIAPSVFSDQAHGNHLVQTFYRLGIVCERKLRV
jgi:hypothetical protein